MGSVERDQYNNFAGEYNAMDELPLLKLEGDLIKIALGDCTDACVLDLGGGSGKHARTALGAGAHSVDLVDISDEMMKIGRAVEEGRGRGAKIRFMLGDVTKPLDDLGLTEKSYDIVMANWVFDHATVMNDLEGMWQNIATYIKPGGRFIGVRAANIGGSAGRLTKYGITYREINDIPGGLSYQVICYIKPPLTFEATSMKLSYSGSTALHEKYGFKDVEYVSMDQSQIVQQDPEFWEEFVKEPMMAIVTAIKA